MAAPAATRCLALMLLASQTVYTQNQFKVPDVTIQALNPKGFRVFMEDIPKLSHFTFQGRLNKPISQTDLGEISGEVTAAKNGRWIYEDPYLELKIGDVINYYVFVVYDRKGYVSGPFSHRITALIFPLLGFKAFPINDSRLCTEHLGQMRAGGCHMFVEALVL